MLNKLNSPLLAVFTLVCVLWLGWVSYTPETGYNHSVFDVLPKGKPYRTQDISETLRLWDDYSKNNLNYDLPMDHLN